MRADFYQLGDLDPARAVAQVAGKAIEAGHRVLVVDEDEARREAQSRALWGQSPESFLANGLADGRNDARQPVLLSDRADAANGAKVVILADGHWRDPAPAFERVMLLFDETSLAGARAAWRMLGEQDGPERRFWKQDERGRWVEGP